MTEPKIALVTGASRGAGAGIARGLGEKGMTVYVTGRTVTPGDARGWDGTVLPGTVAETAAEVTKAGGKGVPVMCDHADDAQVAALFDRIAAEAGRLDILVNNATYIHHQLIEKKPFWEKELDAARILDVGLRSELACGADDGEAGQRADRVRLVVRRELLHARPGLWRAEGGDRQVRARHGA